MIARPAGQHVLRLALAITALLCIGAGTFQGYWWRMFTVDHGRMREWMTALPYARTPGLREFMLGVRDRTQPGSRVLILSPHRKYQGGYVYVFSRATYLLAGRTTVPIIDQHDLAHPQNLAEATYVAAFRIKPTIAGFETVWTSRDGTLLKRSRQ